MKRSHRLRPLILALYANAVLLFAILLALVSHGVPTLPTASASPPPSEPGAEATAVQTATVQPGAGRGVAGNGHLYVMPGELLNNVWGCYVLDLDNQTLCAYGYSGNQLKLYAARDIRFDHELRNFNTSPDPQEIRRLIQLEKTRLRGLSAHPTNREEQPATQNLQSNTSH